MSLASPCIFLELRATVKLFESNVALKSINRTVSPAEGLAGNVAVTAPPDVSTKYPRLDATLNADVFVSHVKSVSTVTEPPKEIAEPFIVIAELARAEFGTDVNRAFGNVPVERLEALVVSTTAKVLSPRKNVVLSLVPDDPSLAIGTVPELRLLALILATLNVPKATISTTSPSAKADAKVTVSPDEIVISAPDNLTPFKYTSQNPASYANVVPFASAPVTDEGVPEIL